MLAYRQWRRTRAGGEGRAMGTRAERQRRKEAVLVSVAAGIMGRLGGAARAAALSEAERQAIGKLGATARNRTLSAARRREIARVAAMARWDRVPKRGG
jgi:hypothetical protein